MLECDELLAVLVDAAAAASLDRRRIATLSVVRLPHDEVEQMLLASPKRRMREHAHDVSISAQPLIKLLSLEAVEVELPIEGGRVGAREVLRQNLQRRATAGRAAGKGRRGTEGCGTGRSPTCIFSFDSFLITRDLPSAEKAITLSFSLRLVISHSAAMNSGTLLDRAAGARAVVALLFAGLLIDSESVFNEELPRARLVSL